MQFQFLETYMVDIAMDRKKNCRIFSQLLCPLAVLNQLVQLVILSWSIVSRNVLLSLSSMKEAPLSVSVMCHVSCVMCHVSCWFYENVC